jgi:hypothetical protein
MSVVGDGGRWREMEGDVKEKKGVVVVSVAAQEPATFLSVGVSKCGCGAVRMRETKDLIEQGSRIQRASRCPSAASSASH